MAGFYGKLPAKGDFLTRNLPRDFIDFWDDWLQSGMHNSREALGGSWLQIYLTSPLWRFVLPSGTCGTSAWAGVFMPSMDKVGRYFPMTVVLPLSGPVSPVMVAAYGQSWFEQVESLLLQALDDEALDLDAFDQQLQALLIDEIPDGSADMAAYLEQGIRLPLRDSTDVAQAVLGLTTPMLREVMDRCSIWWGHGSERVAPSLACCRGLPGPRKFPALLDGNWAAHGWSEGLTAATDDVQIVTELAAE